MAELEARAAHSKKSVHRIDIDTGMLLWELGKRGVKVDTEKRPIKKHVFSSFKFPGRPTASTSSNLQPRIQRIINKVSKVLGSQDDAMRWLGSPVRALDFATPISILGSKEGVKRVNDVLGQMEHGVW